ncbi:hypothetical protein BT63DRAFT_456567 [Microthyrium microscopicum]|uniref:Uncharacterized protein n=1 Tax=Microthyrium microscopicum TaxID=703497 RepID=A0A6A6U748_9PEZI|nr:hypothetical protein BT63DRAFT_456567 [Microthyrium microscopicum]
MVCEFGLSGSRYLLLLEADNFRTHGTPPPRLSSTKTDVPPVSSDRYDRRGSQHHLPELWVGHVSHPHPGSVRSYSQLCNIFFPDLAKLDITSWLTRKMLPGPRERWILHVLVRHFDYVSRTNSWTLRRRPPAAKGEVAWFCVYELSQIVKSVQVQDPTFNGGLQWLLKPNIPEAPILTVFSDPGGRVRQPGMLQCNTTVFKL